MSLCVLTALRGPTLLVASCVPACRSTSRGRGIVNLGYTSERYASGKNIAYIGKARVGFEIGVDTLQIDINSMVQ